MIEVSTSRRTAATRVAALAITFALGAGVGPSQSELDDTTAKLAATAQQASSTQAALDTAVAATSAAEARAAEEAKAAAKARKDLAAAEARALLYREQRDEARTALDAEVVAASVAAAPEASTPPSQARGGSAPATTKASSVRIVDGDTVEIDGVKIRVGLVNTPEKGEGCFDEATRFTRDFLGGRASYNGYATDNYGRKVAEVFNASGQSLNVAIAASRLSDDRYYGSFAHENPDLARRVRAAYEAPRSDCFGGQAAAPAQSSSNCHPDYITCIAIKGNGSGSGSANDLDCGDIRKKVQLRKIGRDPYRLDGSDQDGWGCESYG